MIKEDNEDNWINYILPESKMTRELSFANLATKNMTYVIRKEINFTLPLDNTPLYANTDAKIYLNFSLKDLIQNFLKKKKNPGDLSCESSKPPKKKPPIKTKPKCEKKKAKKKCNTQLKAPCLDSSKKKKKESSSPKDSCKKKETKSECKKSEKKKAEPCKESKKKKAEPCKKSEKKKTEPCKESKKKKADPCKKKEDPCKKSQKKKADPCKKSQKKKEDPCKKKKEDPCKKKKEDPCKKKKEDPCKKKKEDPCKKKKEDPCKKKKEDPCKKKKEDPCKKKKEDPCKKKKEDPCKKSQKKKEDPCKKKENPCAKMTKVVEREEYNIQSNCLAYITRKKILATKLLMGNGGKFVDLPLPSSWLHVRGMKQISYNRNISRKEDQKCFEVGKRTERDNERYTSMGSSTLTKKSPNITFSAISYLLQIINRINRYNNDTKWERLVNHLMDMYHKKHFSNKGYTYLERSLTKKFDLFTVRNKSSLDWNLRRDFLRGTKEKKHISLNSIKCSSAGNIERGDEEPYRWFNPNKITCYFNFSISKLARLAITKKKLLFCNKEKELQMESLWTTKGNCWCINDCDKTLQHKDAYLPSWEIENDYKGMKDSIMWKQDYDPISNLEFKLHGSLITDLKDKGIVYDLDTSKCKDLKEGKVRKIPKCRDIVVPSPMDERWYANKGYWKVYNECRRRVKDPTTYKPGHDPNSNHLLFKTLSIFSKDLGVSNFLDKSKFQQTIISSYHEMPLTACYRQLQNDKSIEHPDAYLLGKHMNANILLRSILLNMKSDESQEYSRSKNCLAIKEKEKLCFCKSVLQPLIYHPLNVHNCNTSHGNDDPIENINYFQLPRLDSDCNDVIVCNMFGFSLDLSAIKHYMDTSKCKRKKEGKKREIEPCYDPEVQSPLDDKWNANESYWPYYNECRRRVKHPDTYPPGEDPNSNHLLFGGWRLELN